MPFDDDQLTKLRTPLAPDLVSQRQQAGRSLSYLEGFEAINQANDILGYDGWSHTISRLDYNPDIKSYMALVLVEVHDPSGVTLCRHEDVGCGIVQGDRAEGHETAMKGAVTDAMKRALRCLGDQFGNVLYDKTSDLHRRAGQQQTSQQAAPHRAATMSPGAFSTAPAFGPAQLKSEVTGLLAKDTDGAALLKKTADEMSPEELDKALTWLRHRAKR